MALTDNLVSYWELEESSGTRVDSHGSNDLTDNNTVLSLTGVQGNAADFEHDSSETLSTSTAGTLNITGDISFSLWIKQETATATIGQAGFFSCFGTTTATRKFILAMTTGGQIRFDVRNSAGGSDNFQFTHSENIGTWEHIVITWQASSKECKFYLDGSQSGSTQTGTNVAAINSVTSYNYVMGGIRTNLDYWDGGIDEFGIWDKVLTSTEVSDLYNSGSGLSYADITGGGTTFTPKVMMF